MSRLKKPLERVLLLLLLLLIPVACGPDLLLPHLRCCEDDEPHLLPARKMSDEQLLRVLEKPDRVDLSTCWREAEKRNLIRLIPTANADHPRLVHDEAVSEKVIARYREFKRTHRVHRQEPDQTEPQVDPNRSHE